MAKAFQRLPRLVQIILLLIPGVNWVTEFIVRLSAMIERPSFKNILGFIIAIPFGIIIGWLDIVWCLLFKRLFFCEV